MILYNQTLDIFDSDAYYENLPSQVFDHKYKKALNEFSDLTPENYSLEKWELERKYQQAFFEEEVDKLLFFSISLVGIIRKIQKYQEYPMIQFEFWDPRDIPQVFNECIDLYSKISKVQYNHISFSLKQISFTETYTKKIYTISEVKSYFKNLSKILNRIEPTEIVKKELNSLKKRTGIPIIINSRGVKNAIGSIDSLDNILENLFKEYYFYIKNLKVFIEN